MQRFVTPENKKWWTLAAVSVGLFMIMLDNTVVNVALPSIRRSLGHEPRRARVGRRRLRAHVRRLHADRRQARRLLRPAADLHGRPRGLHGRSLACGLAPNGGFLIGARVVQGLGGALMNPATLSIITATFAPRERGKAIGIWAGVSAMALAIGPLVGGLLTEHVNWNWIFFINVPIGIAGLLAIPVFIDESRDQSAEQRLDVPGLATSALGLFSLTYAFIEANNYGWTSARILGAFAVAVVALVSFVLLERHQRAPMLDLSLFRNRTFGGANASMLFVGLAMFGTFFYVSLYMQNVLRYSPVEAGASFLPMTILIILIAPRTGALTDRVGSRWLVGGGMTLLARDALLLHPARRARELLGARARAAARRVGHGDDDDAGDGGGDERGRGRQGGRRLGGPELVAAGRRLARHRRHGRDRREQGRLPDRVPRRAARRLAALPRRRRRRGDSRSARSSTRTSRPATAVAGRRCGVTQAKQRLTAEARRQAVLDTACRVFSRSSYRGATTAEIAREAGISEPILYRHFGSKRDLYLACLDEAWASFRDGCGARDRRTIRRQSSARSPTSYMAKGKKIRLIDLWIQALTVSARTR